MERGETWNTVYIKFGLLNVRFFTQPSYKSSKDMSLSKVLSTKQVYFVCNASIIRHYKYMEAGFFTYADRRAGLPVVSVIHLYTGDFVIPLELVSWVTLKGHWIPWLTAISTTTAIHWYTRVPAGCCHWAWTGETERAGREKREQRRKSNYKNLRHARYLELLS